MPIKPANMTAYPGGSVTSKEWLAIRAFVRARAGDRCEGCGLKNHVLGYRLKDGYFVETTGWLHFGDMIDVDGRPTKVIQIVCTVAHLDHGLSNHHTDNLRFWCQQCHNRHDAAHRAAGRRRREVSHG